MVQVRKIFSILGTCDVNWNNSNISDKHPASRPGRFFFRGVYPVKGQTRQGGTGAARGAVGGAGPGHVSQGLKLGTRDRSYFTEIAIFFLLAFASARLGATILSTPFSKLASILSVSTVSGSRRERENAP